MVRIGQQRTRAQAAWGDPGSTAGGAVCCSGAGTGMSRRRNGPPATRARSAIAALASALTGPTCANRTGRRPQAVGHHIQLKMSSRGSPAASASMAATTASAPVPTHRGSLPRQAAWTGRIRASLRRRAALHRRCAEPLPAMAGEHVPHQALHDAQEAIGVHSLHSRMRRRPSGSGGDQVLLHLHEQVGGGRLRRAFQGRCPTAGFHPRDQQPIGWRDRRREPGIGQSTGRTDRPDADGHGWHRSPGRRGRLDRCRSVGSGAWGRP